jgi:hypothetical protein
MTKQLPPSPRPGSHVAWERRDKFSPLMLLLMSLINHSPPQPRYPQPYRKPQRMPDSIYVDPDGAKRKHA